MNFKNIYPLIFYPVKKIFMILLILPGFISASLAQIPRGVPQPQDNDPVAFDSLSDMIIYILLPATLIIIYLLILYRRRRKRHQEDQESNEWEKKHRP
jgi:heme/copper-type cytochrome/quinol oxidase subunit 2